MSRKEPHARLTSQQVFKNWTKEGKKYYTPTGYLYHLLLALRKEGWWYRIDNITEFCDRWKIKRRTFYDAKAALIADGVLEENILGAVELRIIDAAENSRTTVQDAAHPVQDAAHPVQDAAHPVQDAAHPVQDAAQTIPETEATQEFREPLNSFSDLSSDLSSAKDQISPPTPSNTIDGREGEKDPVSGKDSDRIEILATVPNLEQQVATERSTGEDQFSSARRDFSSSQFSSVERFDRQFTHRYLWEGEDRQPLPEFAEFVGNQLPKNDMHPRIKGRSYVLNCQRSEDGILKLEGLWNDYQAVQRGEMDIHTTPPLDRRSTERKTLITEALKNL
ncbi:hypothetical protein H6G63_20745 [Leptolyngbya sp. FACHB-402]|uniref:hypothetical protein n=1 Tax=Leptolyngbya sp. FACHB-402 TaxID=2692809 RepID=UPI001685BFA9|nr:hypothetical protein [Leptolyngbya sp. FACHB-402]MBD2406613.1 hypothetical protein [Leptolyngbya sp. FACHB-402]